MLLIDNGCSWIQILPLLMPFLFDISLILSSKISRYEIRSLNINTHAKWKNTILIMVFILLKIFSFTKEKKENAERL